MIAIKTFQDCKHAYLRPEEPGHKKKKETITGWEARVVWETLGT